MAACEGVRGGIEVHAECSHLLLGSGNARYNALSNLWQRKSVSMLNKYGDNGYRKKVAAEQRQHTYLNFPSGASGSAQLFGIKIAAR
jgi:hypothetical protein